MREFQLIIAGGPIDATDLAVALDQATRVIAADGGANHFSLNGDQRRPDLIVGDLDSIQDRDAWEGQTTVRQVDDQNSTDLDKALSCCDAALPTLVLGALGGRFDQTLTALSALRARRRQPLVFVGEGEAMLRLPQGRSRWPVRPGSRVSLFPLTPSLIARSEGLRYPLSPLKLRLGGRLGTSNQATADRIQLDVASGCCLLLLPHCGMETSLELLG